MGRVAAKKIMIFIVKIMIFVEKRGKMLKNVDVVVDVVVVVWTNKQKNIFLCIANALQKNIFYALQMHCKKINVFYALQMHCKKKYFYALQMHCKKNNIFYALQMHCKKKNMHCKCIAKK